MVNSAVLSVKDHSGTSEWKWLIHRETIWVSQPDYICITRLDIWPAIPFKIYFFLSFFVILCFSVTDLVGVTREIMLYMSILLLLYSPWQIIFATICLLPCSLTTRLQSFCMCLKYFSSSSICLICHVSSPYWIFCPVDCVIGFGNWCAVAICFFFFIFVYASVLAKIIIWTKADLTQRTISKSFQFYMYHSAHLRLSKQPTPTMWSEKTATNKLWKRLDY